MTSTWFLVACGIAVIGCGMVSGFFLTFSDFLMRSLRLSKTSAGIEVMQVINREIWKSVIMILLWSMLALSIILSGYAFLHPMGLASALVIGGGILYVLGGLVVSFAFNVPMNNRLEALDFRGSEAAAYWTGTYVSRWIFWNYFRAIGSGGAAICYLVAGVLLAQGATPNG